MTGQLEPTHEQLADEVTDVQRVGGGVEADVQADGTLGEPCTQCGEVGGVVNEATRLKVVEQIHRAPCCQVLPCFAQPIHRRVTLRSVAETAELQERFRQFAGTATTRAPLYARLAEAIADEPEVADLLSAAPATQQAPVLLLAATHHLVLAGASPALAAYYPNLTSDPDPGDPWPVFRDLCGTHRDQIRAIVSQRHTQTNEVGRCALFLPVFSLVAHDVAEPIAQVDVGTSAGLTLLWARYGYDYRPGPSIGLEREVTLQCDVRGQPPLPRELPAHAPGLGLDLQPIDISDDDAVRWLEACVWPDQTDRFERLEGALRLARSSPPDIRTGDAVDELVATVEEAALRGHPVVTTSWALSYLSLELQRQFVGRLDELGARMDLSWVAAESPEQTAGLPFHHSPATSHLTALSLATWRNGRRELRTLGTAHPHGYWLHWSAT